LSAIEALHREGLWVVGGIIVGNPGDTRASIDANLAFAKRYVDWPYIQHPTPYPGTPMTEDFRSRGLIVNERVEEYDGTTAVVKTEHLETMPQHETRAMEEGGREMSELDPPFLTPAQELDI